MRIISIDPGYERLGIAIIEKNKPKDMLVYSECFKTPKDMPFSERLFALTSEVKKLIKKYKPEVLAIEELFFENNQKTAMRVSEVRGALIYLGKEHQLRICEYTPLEIKVAVTGYGKSDKKAVMMMVPKLITMKEESFSDDELDAIAVGLTCLATEKDI